MSNICHQKTRKITQQLLEEVRGELEDAPEQEREDTRRIPNELLEMIRSDGEQQDLSPDRVCPQASEVQVNLEEMLRLSVLGQSDNEEEQDLESEELFDGLGTELDNLLQHSLFPTESGAVSGRKSKPAPILNDDEDAPGAMWVSKPVSPSPDKKRKSPTDAHPRLNLDQAEDTSSIRALMENLVEQAKPRPRPDALASTKDPDLKAATTSGAGWSIDLAGVLEARDTPGLEKLDKDLDKELSEDDLMELGSAPLSIVPDKDISTKPDMNARNTGDMEILQSPPPAQILKKRKARSITGAMRVVQAKEAADYVRAHRQTPQGMKKLVEEEAVEVHQHINQAPKEMISSQPIMAPMEPMPQASAPMQGMGVAAPQEPVYQAQAPVQAQVFESDHIEPSQGNMDFAQAQADAPVVVPSTQAPSGATLMRGLFNPGTITGAVMILLTVVPMANLQGGWPGSPWIAAVPLLCGTWFLFTSAMNSSLNMRRLGFVGFGGLFFSFCVAPALLHFTNVFPAAMAGLPHLLLITLLAGVLPLRFKK